jgi:hypothetical protein
MKNMIGAAVVAVQEIARWSGGWPIKEQTMTLDELVERLRRSVTDTTAFCPSPEYRNPDGPEAASRLLAMKEALEILTSKLDEWHDAEDDPATAARVAVLLAFAKARVNRSGGGDA